MQPVHVIGASGRSGAALCRALADAGRPFVAIVRNPLRWPGPARIADIADARALRAALADAAIVVSCAHARFAGSILDAAPADTRFVFIGSTRKFTRWPDAHGRGVIAGEAAFLRSGRAGMMLHPTMIYGAAGEDNVQRLAALLRRLPVVPLPNGGRALVQPIHQDDVTRSLIAALGRASEPARAVVIAGPAALAYADFVRAVASAAGLRPPRILPVPAPVLMALSPLLRVLPGMPRVRPAELRRLLEDKVFEISPMRAVLGIEPIALTEGLARSFARPHNSA